MLYILFLITILSINTYNRVPFLFSHLRDIPNVSQKEKSYMDVTIANVVKHLTNIFLFITLHPHILNLDQKRRKRDQ